MWKREEGEEARNVPMLWKVVLNLIIEERKALKMNMTTYLVEVKMQISVYTTYKLHTTNSKIKQNIKFDYNNGSIVNLMSSLRIGPIEVAYLSCKRPSLPCWNKKKGSQKTKRT
jgi:hypothetical protein